jgi:hypothetical protein
MTRPWTTLALGAVAGAAGGVLTLVGQRRLVRAGQLGGAVGHGRLPRRHARARTVLIVDRAFLL